MRLEQQRVLFLFWESASKTQKLHSMLDSLSVILEANVGKSSGVAHTEKPLGGGIENLFSILWLAGVGAWAHEIVHGLRLGAMNGFVSVERLLFS